MITKAPIRLLTLSALELNRRTSFWDIGFCTGSVSIEARLQFPHLHVTSFEIRPEGKRLMEINSRRSVLRALPPSSVTFLKQIPPFIPVLMQFLSADMADG